MVLVSYQSADDDDDTTTAALPVFGPFLPPSRDTDSTSSKPREASILETRQSAAGPHSGDREKSSESAAEDDEVQKLKVLHEKFQKRSQQLKHSAMKDAETVAKETSSHGESSASAAGD